MAAPKQTKRQRIDEAREQARLAREKRERKQKMLKVLVPSLVTLGVLVLAAVIVVVIAIQPKPAAAFPGGPKNMASDGIVFVQGSGDSPKVAPTAALKKGQKPEATEWSKSDGKAHIVTYVDWTCPGCKAFEGTNADLIAKAVGSGAATLEVKPVAILNDNYPGGNDYSSRAANVAACVANYDPSKFLAVQKYVYANQPEEQTAGLSTDKLIGQVHSAGLNDPKVDACIRGQSFRKWTDAATQRALSVDKIQGTPTVTINGDSYQPTSTEYTDFPQFLAKYTTAS